MDTFPGPAKDLAISLEPQPQRPLSGVSSAPLVQEITIVHQQVVMAGEAGFTNQEIGQMFNLNPTYVSQIRNWDHPILKAAKQRARDRIAEATFDVSSRIQAYAGEALDRMVDHMRGPNGSEARLAAKDIMDRAGYAPVKKVAEVRATVPSEEFVAAVQKMGKTDQVASMRDQYAFRLPEGQKVGEVPPPKTGTNG